MNRITVNDVNRPPLERRWPEILRWIENAPTREDVELVVDLPSPTLAIAGLRLASAYDPLAEARLQARLIPADAREATMYGLGNGVPARVLLEERNLKHLRLVIFEPAVAALCLAAFDFDDVLDDPRVELLRACDLTELSPPFAAVPTCLKLAAPEAARLRDLVELELATPHLIRHLREREGELLAHLAANRTRIAADGDVAELFDARLDETVLVAAAGPTLSEHFDRLRERGDALLIAVDAALQPLLAAGIRPEVVVAVDPHEGGLTRIFDFDLSELDDTALVYDPVVHPPVLDKWPGRRFAFYRAHERYAELVHALPRAQLWSSGSVLHPAVDLAVRLGASRVELFGTDFANLHGRTHVDGAAWDQPVEPRSGRAHTLRNGRGETIPSQPNLIGYLRDLERFIARNPSVEFVQSSLDSAAIEGALPPRSATKETA